MTDKTDTNEALLPCGNIYCIEHDKEAVHCCSLTRWFNENALNIAECKLYQTYRPEHSAEARATLLVNFGEGDRKRSGWIDDKNKSLTQMIVDVFERYEKELTALQEKHDKADQLIKTVAKFLSNHAPLNGTMRAADYGRHKNALAAKIDQHLREGE